MHVVITRFPYESALGGEEYHTLEIAKMLQQSGAKVSFVGNCPILISQLDKLGCEVHFLDLGKMPVTPVQLIIFLLLKSKRKKKLLSKLQDIHSNDPITSAYFLSLTEKILATEFIHTIGATCVWIEHQYIRNWLLKSPLRKAYSSLSKLVSIVPISPVNKQTLLSKLQVAPENIQEIVHGVDLAEIQDSAAERHSGLIGASGRLHPKKGFALLLGSIKSLHEKNDIVSGEISGEGDQKDILQDVIIESDMQSYCSLSERKDRESYIRFLHECDVFVLSSIDESETFGLVAAEAMLAGCKVVITDACGISKYIDPTLIRVAKAGSMQSLTDCIANALSQDDSIRQKISDFAAKAFNQDRMFEQYKELLLR